MVADAIPLVATTTCENGMMKLPTKAWGFNRCANDNWLFGVLMQSGVVIVIRCITAMHVDETGRWIDVELVEDEEDHARARWVKSRQVGAPTTRTEATLNVDQITMIFEYADT